MALTLVEKTPPGLPVWFRGQPKGQAGDRKVVAKVVELTFDSSYPTGGEPLVAADVGLGAIVHMVIPSAGGYAFTFERDTNKVFAYWWDYNAVADGPLIQVADTTSLASIVTRALILGTEA